MTTEDRDRVLEIIADGLHITKEELQPQNKLREDLGGDSLDVIEIVMNIEKEFNIVISDELYDSLKTVDDLLNLIEK